MNLQLHPMAVGDIFEKTVTLIGKTFARNLAVAMMLLLVPTIILVIATRGFYNAFTRIPFTLPNIWALVPFIGATILMELGVLFAEIAISFIVGEEMNSVTVDVKEAIRNTFNRKWLSGLGQAFLKYGCILGGLIGLAIIFLVLNAETDQASGITKVIVMLFEVPFFMLLIPALPYLFIKWFFSLTAVAVDGLDPVDSLEKSWHLVEGFWWRTFGIVILLSIVSQFAISVVSLPFTFGSMWTVYRDYYSMLGRTGGHLSPQVLSQFQTSLGPGVGIGSAVTSLLSLMITPVFTVVMYFDLKARHRDFPRADFEEPIAQSSSPAI